MWLFRCPPPFPVSCSLLVRPPLTRNLSLVALRSTQALVKAGADMEAKDKSGLTALQVGWG